MAAPSRNGVPQKAHDGATAVEAYGRQTKHRFRALLDDALTLLDEDRKAGRRDYTKRLADELFERGLTGLGQALGYLPTDAAPAAPGAAVNIGALFLAAARGDPTPAALALPVIDAEHSEVEPNDW